VTKFIVCKQFV